MDFSKASITESHFQQIKDFLKTNKLVKVEKQVEIFHKHFEGPCSHYQLREVTRHFELSR